MKKRQFLLAVALLLFAQCGYASSIGLISAINGVYDYGITLAPGEFVEFAPGASITFFPLAGVTGASVGLLGTGSAFFAFTDIAITPTRVTFALPLNTRVTVGSSATQPITVGDLFIDSLVSPGTIRFTMDTFNEGTIRGKVPGPSPAPEPWSILLLIPGLVSLFLFARRQRYTAIS
jgi:hypothetical protein